LKILQRQLLPTDLLAPHAIEATRMQLAEAVEAQRVQQTVQQRGRSVLAHHLCMPVAKRPRECSPTPKPLTVAICNFFWGTPFLSTTHQLAVRQQRLLAARRGGELLVGNSTHPHKLVQIVGVERRVAPKHHHHVVYAHRSHRRVRFLRSDASGITFAKRPCERDIAPETLTLTLKSCP
jgi:hypothetical protein